jgi:hypothetical protein
VNVCIRQLLVRHRGESWCNHGCIRNEFFILLLNALMNRHNLSAVQHADCVYAWKRERRLLRYTSVPRRSLRRDMRFSLRRMSLIIMSIMIEYD